MSSCLHTAVVIMIHVGVAMVTTNKKPLECYFALNTVAFVPPSPLTHLKIDKQEHLTALKILILFLILVLPSRCSNFNRWPKRKWHYDILSNLCNSTSTLIWLNSLRQHEHNAALVMVGMHTKRGTLIYNLENIKLLLCFHNSYKLDKDLTVLFWLPLFRSLTGKLKLWWHQLQWSSVRLEFSRGGNPVLSQPEATSPLSAPWVSHSPASATSFQETKS